ncbi:lipid-A-disaccharide kinase [Desulfobacula phenolica]|uniref:Tetraacyldisaccharide 4'-kinase n=2 Tax=Desulfobacula phenolica TaxID=90732 RepID=A0A1H2DN39_9BACT|nr:lipid-A-disaccharide kinase [Desulfobacula phenolica]
MARPVVGDKLLSLETLLDLLSKAYSVIIKTKIALYRTGMMKSKKLPCFVISVGNITVGGTGKTPMTVYVADLVQQMGYKVAVISRGYKGKFEQSGGVVCDGHKLYCTPEESGDEPFLIAQSLGVPVLAGKNRYALGIKAIQKFDSQVIVLDDAFQHIKLKRDLDLVLLDAGHPFGNGKLIPRGRLREPISSLERGDAIIFTRSDVKNLKKYEQPVLNKHTKKTPVLRTSHYPHISKIVTGLGRKLDKKSVEDFFEKNRQKQGLLFSGIANNMDFRRTCEAMGMGIAGHLEFPDHCWYKQEDITMLLERYKKIRADFIVTTQKDYVKIAERFVIPELLVVVGVQIRFMGDYGEAFESLIKKKIQSYI